MKKILSLSAIVVAVAAWTTDAQCQSSIPGWVRGGLVLTYDDQSAATVPGQLQPVPGQAIRVAETIKVNNVSGTTVSGLSTFQNVGTGQVTQVSWTFVEGAPCTAQGLPPGNGARFWVDPKYPLNSIKGPNGEPFSVVGTGPVSMAGRNWIGTTLQYKGPSAEYHVTFDTQSGLVLGYAEIFPNQHLYRFFISISGP